MQLAELAYSEDEVVAHLQDGPEQDHAPPHHFEEIRGHVALPAAEIHAVRLEHEAVAVERAAAVRSSTRVRRSIGSFARRKSAPT